MRGGPRTGSSPLLEEAPDIPCSYCGYQPNACRAVEEWPEAIRRWPDLLESLPADHQASSHGIEARNERVARELVGWGLDVAALMVDGLVADAADLDPGAGEARSTYAARLQSERPVSAASDAAP